MCQNRFVNWFVGAMCALFQVCQLDLTLNVPPMHGSLASLYTTILSQSCVLVNKPLES